MPRLPLLVVVVLSVLAVSKTAPAQVLGGSGDAIFSAERLFGVRGEHLRFDRENPFPDTDIDSTTLSIGLANPLLPHNVPRLAFDYLVSRKLSLGGALGYSSNDFEIDGPAGPLALTGETQTFLFAGRVGYLHMFGRVLGIWPRAGLTYHSSSVEGAGKTSDLGLSLECAFPIVLAPHFGFLLGLTFDQGLTGNVDPDGNTADYDFRYRSLALQFGLFGWL